MPCPGIPGFRVVARNDERVAAQNATGSTGGERSISREVYQYEYFIGESWGFVLNERQKGDADFVFLRKSTTFVSFAQGAGRHITT